MQTDRPLTPVDMAEQPWEDPLDGLLSGTYRARPADAGPDDPDHLVVYIRGSGGDPHSEYRGPTAVCGREVPLRPRPERVGDTCEYCVTGVARAFREAREAIANRRPPGELG